MKPSRQIFILLLALIPLSAAAQQFELAGGYNYQNSDEGGGVRINLNGRFASGQFDLNDNLALTLEADSYSPSQSSVLNLL
jgi:hypothetical protein